MDLSLLDPPALGPSAAEAYASHQARALGVAKFYADLNPLDAVSGQAGENNVAVLWAHLHARTEFKVSGPNQPVIDALTRLNQGDGEVGTSKDYDMAVKGLMTIVNRYGPQLGVSGVDFIMNKLIPSDMAGGHPSDLDVITDLPLIVEYPETENHLLMIESSRFLINQMRYYRTGDLNYDNSANGLSYWLKKYMSVIAKHDFLEFNSMPYARLSIHALLNLYEFAREIYVRTAAEILLDYTFMKCAISSTRGRRISPFRRVQHRIIHQANDTDNLWSNRGDQVAGYFLAYTGHLDAEGKPARLPPTRLMHALIAGTSTYRPPIAAYELALGTETPRSLHYFHHGTRPSLPASGTVPDGGVEIYYNTPSFLMTAGGQFLNSGYGSDELDLFKQAWEQTARAQATTLIPKRADVAFHDLIRLEPWPDPAVDPYADDPEDPDCYHTTCVNLGVNQGIMAGANLRPAERKVIRENTSSEGPALTANYDQLFLGWKGSGNDALNVAKVVATSGFGIDGVEGIREKTTLNETSDCAPALAYAFDGLFIAWKGSGNDNINLAFSNDGGTWFRGKKVLGELTEYSPALVSHNGQLFLAWTGEDEHLNVAKITLFKSSNGDFGIDGIERHVVLGHTSEARPALASNQGRLFLGWKGSGNDALNVIHSDDDGFTFTGWVALPENSSGGPSLAPYKDDLFIAWKGSGNAQLNIAQIALTFDPDGAIKTKTLTNKIVIPETSEHPPAVAGRGDQVCLAWTGEDNEFLNLRVARDGNFAASSGPWIFCDLSKLGFYVAAYRTPPANPGDLIQAPENLAIVYAMDPKGTDWESNFDAFCASMKRRNDHLPPRFSYSGVYRFNTILDGEYSVWFAQTELKYTERVAKVADPIGDFTTLPLVKGPYMEAPNGHDGLIEIRHPQYPLAPMTLDFRNIASPTKLDNISGCPKPWIDRVAALVELLVGFHAKAKPWDVRRTSEETGILYEFLLGRDDSVFGNPMAGHIQKALDCLNVDANVSPVNLLSMLAKPSQGSVPALAQALLLIGRRLRQPLAIDQLFVFYKAEPGGGANHKLSDVRNEVLGKALLQTHQARYGEVIADWNELFEA